MAIPIQLASKSLMKNLLVSTCSGIPFMGTGTIPFNRKPFPCKFKLFKREPLVQSQADVYQANELTALPATYMVARLRHKPLIFEIYDLQFPVPETSIGFWHRLAGLLTRFHAIALPRCAGVIATSPLHAQEIRKHFHVPSVTLIRNVPRYQTVVKSERLRQHL